MRTNRECCRRVRGGRGRRRHLLVLGATLASAGLAACRRGDTGDRDGSTDASPADGSAIIDGVPIVDGAVVEGGSASSCPTPSSPAVVGDADASVPGAPGWKTLSRDSAPAARENMVAVRTGSEMLIWGGAYHGPDGWDTRPLPGAAYAPAEDPGARSPSRHSP